MSTKSPNAPDVSLDSAEKAGRKILNSWKEIAAYMGRGLRTVQRYERDAGLPVHRITRNEGSSLVAFSDEIDDWLRNRPTKERAYVRPTLVVFDPPIEGTLSSRKLALEIARFNVLTAYSEEEAYATAEKFAVDGFVIDFTHVNHDFAELCEGLKERYPKKHLFVVTPADLAADQLPKCADCKIVGHENQPLLESVISVFGRPRLV